MQSAFLDTGYLVAHALGNDQHHADAVNHWQSMLYDGVSLVTTSLVLIETVTFINARGFHSKAMSVGTMLLNSALVHLVQVDESLLLEGWDYFRRHSDKRYSLTDCISFIIMEKREIDTAYAFDRNFNQAGFLIEPMRS